MVQFTAENFYYVKADRAVDCPACKIMLRGENIPAHTVFADSFGRRAEVVGIARLDFDKRSYAVFGSDYINFAERIFIISFRNFIALPFKVFSSLAFARRAQPLFVTAVY